MTLKDTIRAFGISLINRHLVQSHCICLKVLRDRAAFWNPRRTRKPSREARVILFQRFVFSGRGSGARSCSKGYPYTAMLSASLMFRSILCLLLSFLLFGPMVVLADEEDYDPCKAGEFTSIFRSQLVVSRLSQFVCESIYLRFNGKLGQFVCARELSYQLSCQISSLN